MTSPPAFLCLLFPPPPFLPSSFFLPPSPMIYECEAVDLLGLLFWSLNVSKFVTLAVEEVWSCAGGRA